LRETGKIVLDAKGELSGHPNSEFQVWADGVNEIGGIFMP